MWGDDYGSIPFGVSESDLNYERGERKKRKQTKEEAMLGIFGDDYSSDDGKEPTRYLPISNRY